MPTTTSQPRSLITRREFVLSVPALVAVSAMVTACGPAAATQVSTSATSSSRPSSVRCTPICHQRDLSLDLTRVSLERGTCSQPRQHSTGAHCW